MVLTSLTLCPSDWSVRVPGIQHSCTICLFVRQRFFVWALLNSQYCTPSLTVDPKEYGVNSEAFVVISLSKGLVLIGGTRYAGEIKKSIFTIMNHILPARTSSDALLRNTTDKSSACFSLSGQEDHTLRGSRKGIGR